LFQITDPGAFAPDVYYLSADLKNDDPDKGEKTLMFLPEQRILLSVLSLYYLQMEHLLKYIWRKKAGYT